ncbi:MAG: aspartate 1-decarboxylase [Bacteroidales bacterium]|nr:aspartate 1-decarboxylase [Bacteroidales bacterium]
MFESTVNTIPILPIAFDTPPVSTYIIKGEAGSGIIGINGAAAHKARVGDLLIIASYASMDFEEAKNWHPTVIFPKDNHLR